jgi:hypothetical protein
MRTRFRDVWATFVDIVREERDSFGRLGNREPPVLCLDRFVQLGLFLLPAFEPDIPKEEAEIPPPDNATLTAAVKDKLLRSPDAPALQIDVKADDGVVTLSGLVTAEVERVSAEAIARTTRGVKDVKNRIIVRDSDPAEPNDTPIVPQPLPLPRVQ